MAQLECIIPMAYLAPLNSFQNRSYIRDTTSTTTTTTTAATTTSGNMRSHPQYGYDVQALQQQQGQQGQPCITDQGRSRMGTTSAVGFPWQEPWRPNQGRQRPNGGGELDLLELVAI